MAQDTRRYGRLCHVTGGSERRWRVLFAYLKRILKLDHLRLRGPNGAGQDSSLPLPPRTSGGSPSPQWPHQIKGEDDRRRRPVAKSAACQHSSQVDFFNGTDPKRAFKGHPLFGIATRLEHFRCRRCVIRNSRRGDPFGWPRSRRLSQISIPHAEKIFHAGAACPYSTIGNKLRSCS